MLLFLFIVTIYGLANFYVLVKLLHILSLPFPFNIIPGFIVFTMTISPILITIYSHKGSEKLIRIYSYIGYMWLAGLVILFPTVVILDLYNLIIQYSYSTLHETVAFYMISPDNTFFIAFFVSLMVNGFGYFEAKRLCVEHLVFKTIKLSVGMSRIRIAHISDLHLGIIVRDKMLDRVIKKIDAEIPDILVSTGDLVDGNVRHINHLAERLNKIRAPMGKYAVMGNHEIYGGAKQTVKFIEEAGFTILRGKAETVNKAINIAGMDFTGGEARKSTHFPSEKPEWEILSELPNDLYTVLLKHRSDVEIKSLGLFDLQLSGHTHKGQIFPMNLATMFLFRYHNGFSQLTDGSAIYVSRGTGTAGPPIRFLSTPEITIIDIVNIA